MAPAADRTTLRTAVLAAVALAAVATAYSSTAGGDFVWDDRALILEQPAAHELRPLGSYFGQVFWTKAPWFEANPVYYRPLVSLSYSLDWIRSGGSSEAFHLTNLLLHLAVCALLLAVAIRFGARPGAAAAAAAAFGVLPRLTEPVAWISGRTDVVATAFALGALLAHPLEPGRPLRRVLAAILLLASLLSKEVGLGALAAIVVLELLRARPLRDGWRGALASLVPALLATAVYAALRLHAVHGHPAGAGVPDATVEEIAARWLAPLQALGAYLLMALDPLRPRVQIGDLGVVDPALVAAGLVALALLAFVFRRGVRARWRPEIWALAAFSATGIALVLHVVPLRLNVVAADRFLYLPAAGVAAALAAGAARLRERAGRAALAAVLVAIPVMGVATYRRAPDWGDELRLWRAGVETTPATNALPRIALGNALRHRGYPAAARRQYERAVPYVKPRGRGPVLGNLAVVRLELGEYDEAAALLRALVAAEPKVPLHHFNLGVAEGRRLAFDAAEASLSRALELFPEYGEARRVLGLVRSAREALAALPPEREGEPAVVRAGRARVWEMLGRTREAEAAWRAVLESGDATAADRRDALAFLVEKGTVAGAQEGLARAARVGLVAEADLRTLRAGLARRAAEEAQLAGLP